MVNICNYLKSVWQNKAVNILVCSVLILATLPLKYSLNSFSIILFTLVAIVLFKKSDFKFHRYLFLPVIYFLWVIVSVLWSSDVGLTIKGYNKLLPFLLIPLSFVFIKRLITGVVYSKILNGFAYIMAIFGVVYLTKALFRYLNSQDLSEFFYHNLVTFDVNAIYISLFMSFGYAILMVKERKNVLDKLAIAFLLLLVFLLSSKNIILVTVLLTVVFGLFYSNISRKLRLGFGISFLILVVLFLVFGNIGNRLKHEYEINSGISTYQENGIRNISLYQALNEPTFKPNDYFSGIALRALQLRFFQESLNEENKYLLGFGFNTSQEIISKKIDEYSIYPGYKRYNFHNQYLQTYAELGIFGITILIVMLFSLFYRSIKQKDFISLYFIITVLSSFVTESYLARQRGIVFFVFFYCLLHLYLDHKKNLTK